MRRSIPLLNPEANPHACTPSVRLHVLGLTPMFRDLSPQDLVKVDAHCRVHSFNSGDAVYHAGQDASRMYVVATGAIKVLRPAADGRETMLDLCGPGDFLGAVPALGQATYSDSAWAVAATCLLGFDAGDFTTILSEFPQVALATLRGVSRRLSVAQQSVHLLSGAPLEQRLAAVLLLLLEKVGGPWEGGMLLRVPLSREDIASMVGATPESVSRFLSAWRKNGIIESGRKWIAIHDVQALEQLRNT